MGVLVLLLVGGLTQVGGAERPALQGFGASTPGGAGGTVVRVTTLDDSGRGSLRQALRGGNRTIVFNVAGEIRLNSHIYVGGAYVTIDGFSAPAPGITLRGHGLIIRGNRGSHDVIVRGIRVRDSAIDGIQVAYGAHNVVIDHVSVSGSSDGNIDITESHDVTVSWSIVGNNRKNMLIKYGPARVTLHHNVLAGSLERSPQVRIDDTETAVATDTTADIRNNVVANWHTGYGSLVWYGPRANVVNNVYASAKQSSALEVRSARVFTSGNVLTGESNRNREGTESTAFAAPAVETHDACGGARLALAHAGVRPLDAVDQQILGAIALPTSCPAAPLHLATGGSPGLHLVATPESLSFHGVEKGVQPTRQTLKISTGDREGIAWIATVTTRDGGHWLAATPATGTTPGQLVVEASVAGLTAGTYPATVSIAAQGATDPALSIPVELVVAPAAAGEGPARSP